MKNERKITVPLMDHLRTRLRKAVVTKQSDVITSAIPDILVAWNGYTFQIENKYWRKRDTLRKINKNDQLIYCHELAQATQGRCWVSIYREDPEELIIYQPRVLMAQLFPRVVLLEHKALDPVQILDPKATNVFRVLNAAGAIKIAGWDHELQRCLILDSFQTLD